MINRRLFEAMSLQVGDQVLAVGKDGSLFFDDVYFFGHANTMEAIPGSCGVGNSRICRHGPGRNLGGADLPCWI